MKEALLRFNITVLYVTSHSEIDTSLLAGRQRVEQASELFKNVLFSKLCEHNVLIARVHV